MGLLTSTVNKIIILWLLDHITVHFWHQVNAEYFDFLVGEVVMSESVLLKCRKWKKLHQVATQVSRHECTLPSHSPLRPSSIRWMMNHLDTTAFLSHLKNYSDRGCGWGLVILGKLEQGCQFFLWHLFDAQCRRHSSLVATTVLNCVELHR